MIRILVAVGLASLALVAGAEGYPSKTVTIIVPVPPGGGTDMFARIIGQGIAKSSGRSVVIDNRSGAGGTIAAALAAGAAPDGHTLFYSASSIVNHNTLYPNLTFDVARDLVAVSRPVMIPYVLAVHPSLPASSVKELLALAKARPGALNFGGSGAGSQSRLAMEMLKLRTGTDMMYVPYRGAGPVMNALVSGEVGMALLVIPLARPLAENGKLRVLAVTSRKRMELLPQAPTMIEAGVPDFEAIQWHGMFVPARTPQTIVQWLHANIRSTLQRPETRAHFAREGAEPVDESSQEFARFFASEVTKWREIIQRAGVKPAQM